MKPGAYQALYGDLPRQCTNCGLRFPHTEEGGKDLQEHLDAHFRKNIRMKDKAKKVLARVWFPTEQDWIKNVESKDSDKPALLFATGAESKEPEVVAISKVPAGSDHADRTCPICQEKINIAWDDEADEWMYNDAIKGTDDEIFHSYCSKR